MGVFGHKAIGEFVHVRRANRDGSGRFEAGDNGGVACSGRIRGEDLRAGQGREPGNVKEILRGKRNPSERARVAAIGNESVNGVSVAERLGFKNVREAVQFRVAGANGFERSRNGLAGTKSAGANCGCDSSRVEEQEFRLNSWFPGSWLSDPGYGKTGVEDLRGFNLVGDRTGEQRRCHLGNAIEICADARGAPGRNRQADGGGGGFQERGTQNGLGHGSLLLSLSMYRP